MKADELLSQMEKRKKALNFFLKKDYAEKLTDKQVFVLKNCEITLEYCEVNGKICDITNKAYIVVKPDEERNCIDILATVKNGDVHSLIFSLYGIDAERILNEDEVFSSVHEYVDKKTITYKLTIKKSV